MFVCFGSLISNNRTMFHKNALLINCVLLGFCGVSYYSALVMQIIPSISSNLEWHLSKLLFISKFVIFFCFISVVFVIISSHFTTVKVGRPHVDSLTIAYKYGHSDSVSTSAVHSSYKLFPSNDKVQICYERKTGPFGLAHGVVIHEPTDETKAILISHGYSIFKTKPISNAVYISSPAVPWLSYFGQWLVLIVIYPKLYKYSKTHKLSAYPVLELYRRFSVTLIAPLSQQDVFVVPEAEQTMQRSTRQVNLSMDSSMTERSCSTSYHSTRVKFSETDTGTTMLTPRHSLSPIESVKTTKISISPLLRLTPLTNGYTGKIILKQTLTPIDNNNVAKPISVRTSTTVPSNGNAGGEE